MKLKEIFIASLKLYSISKQISTGECEHKAAGVALQTEELY